MIGLMAVQTDWTEVPNLWAHLSEREHVLDALQLLADLDRLAVHVRETGGREATIYEANPRGFEP